MKDVIIKTHIRMDSYMALMALGKSLMAPQSVASTTMSKRRSNIDIEERFVVILEKLSQKRMQEKVK